MYVSCFGLVVSTCQVIGWKDSWGRLFAARLSAQTAGWRDYVFFAFFVWFVYVTMWCVSLLALHYI